MSAPKTNCSVCNAEILVTTANTTGGMCMPCSQGGRYHYVDYLSIEDFFAKATTDDCLAPNLDPHPMNEEFKVLLECVSHDFKAARCVIPVIEYQDEERQMNPYSDRVFIAGKVKEDIVARWAKKLRAEFYQQERPGKEMPLEYAKDHPGWFLVWD